LLTAVLLQNLVANDPNAKIAALSSRFEHQSSLFASIKTSLCAEFDK